MGCVTEPSEPTPADKTKSACKLLGVTMPDFKGCTQAEVDAKLEAWRAKGGPLQTAIRAHRKKWHPDRRKADKAKATAHARFTEGESAAEYLLTTLRVVVRPPRPKAPPRPQPHQDGGWWDDLFRSPEPPGKRQERRQQQQPPPPPPEPPRKPHVAQATGIPPGGVRTPPRSSPRSPPPPPHPVEIAFGRFANGMNGAGWHPSMFVEIDLGGAQFGVPVDLDAVLSSVFGALLDPGLWQDEPVPAPPRGRRRGFKLAGRF